MFYIKYGLRSSQINSQAGIETKFIHPSKLDIIEYLKIAKHYLIMICLYYLYEYQFLILISFSEVYRVTIATRI